MIKKIVAAALSVFLLQTVNAKDVLVLATPNDHEANILKEGDGNMTGELLLDTKDYEYGVIEFNVPDDFVLEYYRTTPAFLEFIPEGEVIDNFQWTKMVTFIRTPNLSRELEGFFSSFVDGMKSFDESSKVTTMNTKTCNNLKSKMMCISMNNPYVGRHEVTCARVFQSKNDLWIAQYSAEVPEGENNESYIKKGSQYLLSKVYFKGCKNH